jgi:hypothetical protein
MLDHAAFYFPVDRARAFDRIRSGGESITLREVVAAQTGTPALRIALVDVTSPDVATGPFRVVRAVSPDLQPLTYGYGFDRPPIERIQRMGVASDVSPIHPIW